MHTSKSFFRLIAGSSIGTILEWYDFSLFAFLTPVLAPLFFPHENALTALMLTYAVFAIGFLVRPIGAMIFGHFGDRVGRKKILIVSILLMSLPTFFIGLVPTYQTIGIAAPLLLILMRIFQGLSAGGESTGAVLFVMESTGEQYRGLMGGLIWATVGLGMLLGSLASLLVQHSTLPWAWRIPFLLGLLTGIVGYFLRKKTLESPLFEKIQKENHLKKFPLLIGISQYKKEMLINMGLYALSAMITYLIFIFMPGYAVNIIGLSPTKTTLITTFAYLAVTLLVPFGGLLSDKIGQKKCLQMGALAFLFLSYVLFHFISNGSIHDFLIAEIFFVIFATIYQGSLNAGVFDLVPTQVRYSVIAVGYNISYSLFGGTVPFLASYLVKLTGNKAAPGLYLTVGALIATVAVVFMKGASGTNRVEPSLGSALDAS